MRYRKTLAAVLVVLLSGLAAADQSGGIDVEPLNQTVIDTNSSINSSSISKNTLPFQLETGSDSITANISLDFPPRQYTGQVILENNYSRNYTVNLQPYTDWQLNKKEIEKVVNVGTSGRFTDQSIQLTGNTNTTVTTEISGNVSEFLDVTDQVTVFPGINSSLVLSYQVPRTTEYGNYTGVLNLTADNGEYQEVPIRFQFKDNITPEIQSVETPSFDATYPKQFVVEASDNIGVDSVNATVLREVTINGSKRNETVEELQFQHENNTDRWKATPPADTNGTFYLDGEVVDEAGNQVNFSSKYTVRPLDAVNVESSLELRNYRVESEINELFGEVNRSTSVEVTLESFSQPLQSPNETWTLAVQTGNGKQFLREEKSTISVRGPTDMRLFVYGDSAERFNGKLSFEPVDQHIPVNNVSFSGSYLDCAVPKKKRVGVFNKSIQFTPVNSDNCVEAGLNVSYFISASTIDDMDNIGDSMKVYIPRDVEEDIDQQWKQRVEERESRIKDLNSAVGSLSFQRNSLFALLIACIGGWYWYAKEGTTKFFVPLKSTKSPIERLKSDDEG